MAVESIRAATIDDVPAIVDLAAQKHEQYREYQPVFWRLAADATEKHTRFIKSVIHKNQAIVLVHTCGGAVDGFVIANVMNAPPVYDPGGKTCMIDDFMVAHPQEWSTVGVALVERAAAEAKARGATQTVVVCGHLDEPKRGALRAGGFSIASEWHVR